ncbi:uncharacterized protein LOC134744969 [Cydia strobilella]|uniref:uncharacterized protein LOC134744969 n=1 Tax=Cydia strobilella TaxID=1100964 RepID=UPI003006BEE4
MTNYEIKPFNGDNWEVFEQQLESLILLNDVPEEKKVALLITKITSNVFETLQILCKTKKPITLTYKELCDTLTEKYKHTKTPLLDRAEFRRRNQLPTESVDDYVLNLRKLSRKCQFKDEEDQIKEKLVDGVYSKLIKFELMKQSAEAKLEDLIKLAKTVESAYKQANGEEETSNISYVKPNSKMPRQRYAPSKKNNNNNTKSKCFCCGKDNHMKKDCTLKTKFCSECGQQGHIYKMCPKKYRQTNMLEVTNEEKTEDQGLEDIKNLYEEYPTYTFDRVSRIPPHFIELTIGHGQKVQFEVDTGSEVSVMPLKFHKKYLKEYTMEKSKAIFRNFDQSESQPLGIIYQASGADRARLNAASAPESGAWMHALPSPNLGTLLDNDSLRVAVALRLGCDVCQPHLCICGSMVESNGHHALSCCRCAGRFPRHHALNDIVRRALVSANVPCVLEPPGLSRSDGKRPDGLTLVPWEKGKCLLWDATCVSTFAASHLGRTVRSAGAAAEQAASLNRDKYSGLTNYLFVPLAVETSGCWCAEAKTFLGELGRRLRERGLDPRSGSFLSSFRDNKFTLYKEYEKRGFLALQVKDI